MLCAMRHGGNSRTGASNCAYFKDYRSWQTHREYLSNMVHTQAMDFLVISSGIGTPPLP